MAATTDSLLDLLRPEHDRTHDDAWRWSVRRQLVPVRDRLLRDHAARDEEWLSARAGRALHERDLLLTRLHRLSAQVLVAPDPEAVAGRLSRLLVDIEHHVQRLHDLAYDDVELEIGGSE